MNKKQFLEYLTQTTYCRLAPSKIEGVGVFAIRDIPKNTNPFQGSYEDEYFLFKKDELDDLSKEIKNMIDDFCIPEDNIFPLPKCGLNRIDISFFMNHSDKPNMKTDDGYDTYISTRDIKAGEELTFYYPKYKEKVSQSLSSVRKRK